MPTLMGQNPQTSSEQPLHKSVYSPQNATNCRGGNILRREESMSEVEDSGQRSHISSYIAHSTETGAFEAVTWYCFVNLTDSKVGNFESVAIGVDKLGGGDQVLGS